MSKKILLTGASGFIASNFSDFLTRKGFYVISFDKRKYNYKINQFTYKLRKGKNIKLKKHINLKKGISSIINS
jgi:nucleoside-diphosphate-sugar epimerase